MGILHDRDRGRLVQFGSGSVRLELKGNSIEFSPVKQGVVGREELAQSNPTEVTLSFNNLHSMDVLLDVLMLLRCDMIAGGAK